MINSNSFNANNIISFHKNIIKDQSHRYKSWEHCFNAFQNVKDVDTLALHLGFYLASWGMYRGSSGLLQKDYKVHVGAVEILLNEKYKLLHCKKGYEIIKGSIPLIIDLKKELSEHYESLKFKKVKGRIDKVKPTETLISKIILGTLGCVPAYDRFFIEGLKASGMEGYRLNKTSLTHLFSFIAANKNELLKAQKIITESGTHYPLMKLVDMHFWMVGMQIEFNEL